jgi:hypothetical protein
MQRHASLKDGNVSDASTQSLLMCHSVGLMEDGGEDRSISL